MPPKLRHRVVGENDVELGAEPFEIRASESTRSHCGSKPARRNSAQDQFGIVGIVLGDEDAERLFQFLLLKFGRLVEQQPIHPSCCTAAAKLSKFTA